MNIIRFINKSNQRLSFWIVVLFFIVVSSCKKTNIEGDTVPSNQRKEILITNDFSFLFEQVETKVYNTANTGYGIIGGNGNTVAHNYFQIQSQQINLPAVDSIYTNGDYSMVENEQPVVDSSIITFYVNDYYGAINQPINVKAYELVGSFSGEDYSSLDSIPVLEYIGETNHIDTSSFKIKLSKSFSEKITNNTGNIYGVKLVANKNANTLYKLSQSTTSKVTVYYHYNRTIYYNGLPQYDTQTGAISFGICTTCSQFNQYEKTNDIEFSSQEAYISPLSGNAAQIKLIDVAEKLNGGKAIITKAELLLKTINERSKKQLFLYNFDTDSITKLVDDEFEDEEHFGGNLNEEQKEYRFNITRQLQEYLIDYQSDKSKELNFIIQSESIDATKSASIRETTINIFNTSFSKSEIIVSYTVIK